jgi:hypothetical protein
MLAATKIRRLKPLGSEHRASVGKSKSVDGKRNSKLCVLAQPVDDSDTLAHSTNKNGVLSEQPDKAASVRKPCQRAAQKGERPHFLSARRRNV